MRDYKFYYGIMDNKEIKTIESIVQYFKLWESFDFFTFLSDDYSVTRKGEREKSRLREVAGDNPILNEICTKYCNHDGSLGRKPKPKLEDYIGAKDDK